MVCFIEFEQQLNGLKDTQSQLSLIDRKLPPKVIECLAIIGGL